MSFFIIYEISPKTYSPVIQDLKFIINVSNLSRVSLSNSFKISWLNGVYLVQTTSYECIIEFEDIPMYPLPPYFTTSAWRRSNLFRNVVFFSELFCPKWWLVRLFNLKSLSFRFLSPFSRKDKMFCWHAMGEKTRKGVLGFQFRGPRDHQ